MGTSAARKHKPAARTTMKRTNKAGAIATPTRKLIRHEAPDRGEPIGEALESRQTEREAPDAGEGVFHSHVFDF